MVSDRATSDAQNICFDQNQRIFHWHMRLKHAVLKVRDRICAFLAHLPHGAFVSELLPNPTYRAELLHVSLILRR
jgi:hypothetical protein